MDAAVPLAIWHEPSARRKCAESQVPLKPEMVCAEVGNSVLFTPLMILLVSVSVVALPTRVSVAAGRVSAPEATGAGGMEVVPLVTPGSMIMPPDTLLTAMGPSASALMPSWTKLCCEHADGAVVTGPPP